MKNDKNIRKISIYSIIVCLDIMLLLAADIFAFATLMVTGFLVSRNFSDYVRIAPYVIAFKIFCLYIFQLYAKPKYKSNFITAIYILKAATASAMITALAAYFLRADSIPRSVIILSWFYTVVFISSWRMLARWLIELFAGRDFFKSRLLIIGSDSAAEKMAMRLLNDASIDYKLIGFISCDSKEGRTEILKYPVICRINDLPSILRNYVIDEAVLTCSSLSQKELTGILASFGGRTDISLRMAHDIYENVISHTALCDKYAPLISTAAPHGIPMWYPTLKRIMDVALSALLLLVLSPLLITIAFSIKLTSRGPVLYVTKRVGYMGGLFVMYKFRSMRDRPGRGRIERWAMREDSRTTFIGVFLRRFRLDELPQLFNVIKGDMSLIGPRPESRYYVNQLLKEIPLYSERFRAKPGISGWAQVSFGYAGSVEESKEKLLYDVYYVQNQSLALDALIVLKTIKTILLGAGVR